MSKKRLKQVVGVTGAVSLWVGLIWWFAYASTHLTGWKAFPIAMTGAAVLAVGIISCLALAILAGEDQ